MGLIIVKEHTSENLDHEDGSIIYHLIKDSIKKNEVATLDFTGIDIVTSSFLNTSFSLLVKDFEYIQIKKLIKIRNSTKTINWMINNYITKE